VNFKQRVRQSGDELARPPGYSKGAEEPYGSLGEFLGKGRFQGEAGWVKYCAKNPQNLLLGQRNRKECSHKVLNVYENRGAAQLTSSEHTELRNSKPIL